MVTDGQPPAPPLSRPITMEDVQRIVGALTLELEILRRENVALRATLQKIQQVQTGDPVGKPS